MFQTENPGVKIHCLILSHQHYTHHHLSALLYNTKIVVHSTYSHNSQLLSVTECLF